MIWLAAGIVAAFGAGALLGAPFLPTRRQDVEQALKLSGLQPGQKIYDFGCGDGRLLEAAAKCGISGVGYEINPLLYVIAKVRLWPWRKLTHIYLGSFWSLKEIDADAVYVFLIGHRMQQLDQLIGRCITRPLLLVSYVFPIPGRRPDSQTDNMYVYRYKLRV